MEQQDHQQKHVCKFCNKTFPCGQSLGGHMRSHVVNLVTSDTTDVAKYSNNSLLISNGGENNESSKLNFQENSTTNTSYRLRDNPKKTSRIHRLNEEEEEVVSDEFFCKPCGKGFLSSKALFGHMKCHSEKLIINPIVEEDFCSESDGNELYGEGSSVCSKRRSVRMMSNKTSYASEDEKEDVAKSLMMLSKDNWVSNESCSEQHNVGGCSSKRVNDEENEDRKKRKEIFSDHIYSWNKMVYNGDETVFNKRVSKRTKYPCVTCKKIFHSYQALGGHRASHKKIKGCYASKLNQGTENSSEQADHSVATKTELNLTVTEDQEMHDMMTDELDKGKSVKDHECPFCFKVFSSGQALGGHKRSHLLNSSAINSNQGILIQEPMTNGDDLLDLNLPAPTEDATPSPSQVTDFSRPWRGLEV